LHGSEHKTVLLHFAVESEANQLVSEQSLMTGDLNHRKVEPTSFRCVKRIDDTETFTVVVFSNYSVHPVMVHGSIIRRIGIFAPPSDNTATIIIRDPA